MVSFATDIMMVSSIGEVQAKDESQEKLALALPSGSCGEISPQQLSAQISLELGEPVGAKILSQDTVILDITCNPGNIVRVSIYRAGLQEFSREFPEPDEPDARSRFLAITAAECVHDWRLLRELKENPPPEAPPKTPPKIDPEPSAETETQVEAPVVVSPTLRSRRQLGLVGVGLASDLPGVSAGFAVRWQHSWRGAGGYVLDAQGITTSGEATLGGWRATQWLLGLGYLYAFEPGSERVALSPRLFARAGAARWSGQGSSDDVEVRPFVLPIVQVGAGAEVSVAIWRGWYSSLGGELTTSILSASAALGEDERASGDGVAGRLEFGFGRRF